MSIETPKTAMVFAAGLGKRMRSHRSDIPKPLVPVAGRTLIDRVLDKLVAVKVQKAVVNVSYMGEQIKSHLADRRDIEIIISEELPEPLETGGGIVKAMPHLGLQPFYVVNSDISWLDSSTPALVRLAEMYDDAIMDALLLACQTVKATGYDGIGDFAIDACGRVRRRHPAEVSPFVFGGVQIINPRIFASYVNIKPIPVFSLSQLFHGGDDGFFERIFAISHDSTWMHIGDGRGVAEAEAVFMASI